MGKFTGESLYLGISVEHICNSRAHLIDESGNRHRDASLQINSLKSINPNPPKTSIFFFIKMSIFSPNSKIFVAVREIWPGWPLLARYPNLAPFLCATI